MNADLVNVGLAFLEGFALIISPCILPILPIVLAGSLEGSRRRPLGIIVGFVLAFALFTFFSRKIVQAFDVDLSIVRNVSYGLLLLLGVIMLSTYLTEKFTVLTQRLANTGSSFSSVNSAQSGFWGGVVFGGLVGLIWTPCAGPILAAVIVQTVLQKTTLGGFFVVLAFGIGAAVPMLMIVIFGRSVMQRFTFFRNRAMLFRKILGAIIIASVVYMIFGSNLSVASADSTAQPSALANGLTKPYPAPQIAGITEWINTPPLDINQLKGKVVLVDFWTYSCINCIRTLPFLKDWYNKYHAKGFEIIGVHSPEFEFEKDANNVKAAVARFGIRYPVALDSQFGTWQSFNNSYWPAQYLIDKNGLVVYQHFGEGDDDKTENNIRFLLGMNKAAATANANEEGYSGPQTPETYFGYDRAQNFASPEVILKGRESQYTYPESLDLNQWALKGGWIIGPQYIVSSLGGMGMKMHFNAGKVFVVMGSAVAKPISVKLMFNGLPIVEHKGADIVNSAITVSEPRLYEALVFDSPQDGVLELFPSMPGLEIYTFTFGM